MADFISDVQAQVPPVGEVGGIASLNDFTDINKLVSPDKLKGLTGDLGSIGSKLKDIGAKFKSPADATKLFSSISIPKVPSFDGAFSSLSDMIAQHQPELDKLSLGTSGIPCSGPLGVPSVEDFMGPVSGGPECAALAGGPVTAVNVLSGEASSNIEETMVFETVESTSLSGSGATFNVTVEDGVYVSATVALGGSEYTVDQEITISGYALGGTSPENDLVVAVTSVGSTPLTAESIQKISDMCDRAAGLFAAAGVDLDAPPAPPTLGSLISAATSLHKIGSESNGIGSADMLKKMIPSGSVFGDAIKTAMAEGQNIKAMAAAGIKLPQFNPFDGIKGGGDIDLSTQSAQKLLGG